MLHKTSRPRSTLFIQSIACILCAIALLCAPQHVFAHALPTHTAADGPTFQASIGFNSRFRDGNWVPVHVTLQNTGADFTGMLAVNIPTQSPGSTDSNPTAIYRTPIALPAGAQKQITLYAPCSFGNTGAVQNIVVTLFTANGQKVGTPQSIALHSLQNSEFFVGILSDRTTGFGPISGLSLPQQPSSVIVETLNATTMPTNAVALDNFNLLVLDNFDTSTLNAAQHDALQQWINRGGSLVLVGGPEWRRTFGTLPAPLVPLAPTNTTTLPAGTPLLPINGVEQKSTVAGVPAPVTISTASTTAGTVLLRDGSNPLLVQLHSGQGNVFYLAFDPTLDPIVGWAGASTLWKGILLRVLGDQAVAQLPSQYNASGIVGTSKTYSVGITNALQSLLPNTYPSTWLILILLLAYILVLGPIRLLLVRRLKKRDWSWRIALVTILVFSLLTYGFALQQKGTAIVSDSITVMQLDNSTTPNANAHTTTYLGVFVPSQGDFQVHIPEESLVQPNKSAYQYMQGSGGSSSALTTITPTQGATDVNLQGVDIWTLRSIASERDRKLQGNISSHLTVINGAVTGSITNKLPYSLHDVNILIGNQYLSLGQLDAGQTQQVQLPLSSPNLNTYPLQSLGSQIAAKQGIQQPYNTNSGQPFPQDETHRHAAILAAFNGNDDGNTYCNPNGTCYQTAMQSSSMHASLASMPLSPQGVGFLQSGGGGSTPTIFHSHDPLTIANAPITLIGWADPQSDLTSNITINGTHPSGQQEILVQAPLPLSFTGGLTLDPSFMNGQLVDVQGADIQGVSYNVYALGKGSMTYEYTVPGNTAFQAQTLTIGQVVNLNQIMQPGSSGQPFIDANNLQVQLYNWKTHAWDAFAFNQYVLTIKNPQVYVGTSGRILIQLANTGSSSSRIVFNKPLLQIQGTW